MTRIVSEGNGWSAFTQEKLLAPSHVERQKKYFAKSKGCIGKDKNTRKKNQDVTNWKGKKILIQFERKTENNKKWYQEWKKVGKTTIPSPAYKTTSTLTRAIYKAESSLPNSCRKLAQVVQKLFEETCCSLSRSPAKTLMMGGPSIS